VKISKNGLDLIKSFEALRLAPYLDTRKRPTVGYGTTYYTDGTRVKIDDPPISQERAIELLAFAVNANSEEINSMVRVPISQNQFDAISSLAYNIGWPRLSTSTLIHLLNEKLYDAAASQFLNWDIEDGHKSEALLSRRIKEMILFKEPV
jgi:lysozyme